VCWLAGDNTDKGANRVGNYALFPMSSKVACGTQGHAGLRYGDFYRPRIRESGLAVEVALYFRVKNEKAKQIVELVKKVVATWKTVASQYKISKNDQELMRRAFESGL